MLQYDSKLYVQVLLSSYVTTPEMLQCVSPEILQYDSTVCSGPLKFFTLQAPEMLQYVSQLYVQVLLSSLRYKLLKCCNMILNCMFRSS